MDTVIADWLVENPQCVPDEPEDLTCVDQWLNQGAIDIGPNFEDDEIARSLEEFSGREFFSESPPHFADNEIEQAPPQQPSTSSQPTSSGDGPSSSGGAVCDRALSIDTGHLSRVGAFRSFSTNDLQMLLDHQQTNVLPLMTGLSAPPHHYINDVGMTATKGRGRPVLESVPEGAPSPAAPLLISPMPVVVSSHSLPVGGPLADSGIGGNSSALCASPGSVEILSHSAPERGSGPASVAAYGGNVALPVLANGASLPLNSAPGSGSNALLSKTTLRHVPSMGTLSVLMDNTLSFQREGTDESTRQQQQQEHSITLPAQQLQRLPEEAVITAKPTPHDAPPGGTVSNMAQSIDYSSGAAAAVAAAAGGFPVGAVPSLAQAFPVTPTTAGYFGMGPALYSSAINPFSGPFPLGLSLTLPASNLFAGQYVGSEDVAAAAAVANVSTSAMAGGSCEMSGNSNEAAMQASAGMPNGPRLRKSQSAMELGAWRSCSLELGGDAAETGFTGPKLIGRLTPEERMQRILRYRSKRNNRNFNREIKYQCRKTLADSRPRVGGRFARNDDPNIVLPHQTKKAMRMKKNASITASTAVVVTSDGVAGSSDSTTMGQGATVAALTAPTDLQLRHLNGQSRQLRIAQPTCSSTTSGSVSTDNQATLCSSAGTAAAAVTSCTMPAAVHASSRSVSAADAVQPHTGMLAAACGIPFVYSMAGMPSTDQDLIRSGIYPPPGALISGVSAINIHHHYAAVNAAAQAAAHGVYANLETASMHGFVIPNGSFGSVAVPLVGEATVNLAGPAVPLTLGMHPKVEEDDRTAALALGPSKAEAHTRMESSPLVTAWNHPGRELKEDALHPESLLAVVPTCTDAGCMVVDG